jgi:hypothetical protein
MSVSPTLGFNIKTFVHAKWAPSRIGRHDQAPTKYCLFERYTLNICLSSSYLTVLLLMLLDLIRGCWGTTNTSSILAKLFWANRRHRVGSRLWRSPPYAGLQTRASQPSSGRCLSIMFFKYPSCLLVFLPTATCWSLSPRVCQQARHSGFDESFRNFHRMFFYLTTLTFPWFHIQALDLAWIKSHNWRILSCSAVTGQNIVEGIDWVVNDIANRLYYSSTTSTELVSSTPIPPFFTMG